MINFLYCFDENYNFQAFSSIISLLDNVSEKINIFVIHKQYAQSSFFPDKILKHNNLNFLEVYKFDKDITNYPNLFNAHVSEATYYRLFCSDYLPKLETVLYIDSDIICVDNPINHIKEENKNLLNSEHVFSAKTEFLNQAEYREVFDRLELKNNKYFNAGVMNINLSKWEVLDYDFTELFNNVGSRLIFWDQDLLNYLFDGKYCELNSILNTVVDFSYYEFEKNPPSINDITKDKSFIHFAGSHKPWSVNGIMVNLSEIYQREFRKISKNYFHITHKVRKYSLYVLYRNLVNLKFFKIKHRTRFVKEFIKSMLKINIKLR